MTAFRHSVESLPITVVIDEDVIACRHEHNNNDSEHAGAPSGAAARTNLVL